MPTFKYVVTKNNGENIQFIFYAKNIKNAIRNTNCLVTVNEMKKNGEFKSSELFKFKYARIEK